MQVFDTLWHLDIRNFHDLNEALLILFPKSVDASSVKDYRPIVLIHTIGKLVSKVLASQLAPHLRELVHANQSAFIKGRFIQDNFKLVQWTTKWLHARKKTFLAPQGRHCTGVRLRGMDFLATAARAHGVSVTPML
jgi:hypothetical protein